MSMPRRTASRRSSGRANAHEIAGLGLGQPGQHAGDHGEHDCLRLADGKPAQRVAVKFHRPRAPWRFRPARTSTSPPWTMPNSARPGFAANAVLERSAHFSDKSMARRASASGQGSLTHSSNCICDVGPEQILNFHRPLGGQAIGRAVDVGLKRHAILVELSELGERHDLKAAGIGQDRPRPIHELMQAAERRDPLRAWPQHQMIGVGEHDIGAERFHPFRMHRLDGGRRADRHEGRRADRSPRRRDEARARVARHGL